MRLTPSLIVFSLATAACGDSVISIEEICGTEDLPLSGVPDGPTVTDVGLELQPGEGVVIVATATDPQGSENLQGVSQSVAVFLDRKCETGWITLSDDLVGSGVEETFGTVVSATEEPELYAAIAAESDWPVRVDFTDVDGNRTRGRVLARIIR